MALFLAWTDDADLDPDAPGPWRELFLLHPGVALVDSDQSRSAVYHSLKDAARPGARLVVGALDGSPKMKGVAPGAVSWARAR